MMKNRAMNFTEITNNQIVSLHINKIIQGYKFEITNDEIDYFTGEYDGYKRAVYYVTKNERPIKIIAEIFKLNENEQLRKNITNYDALLEQTTFYKNLKLLDEL